jgi:hypothetical protein
LRLVRNSIKRRLITTVVLSQALLAVGLLLTGVYYTRRRLLAALDASLQSRAISMAALVRYPEDKSSQLIFDDTLLPEPLDRHHPDFYQVSTEDGRLLA